MSYPVPAHLVWPIEPYRAGRGYWQFGDKAWRKLFFRTVHLGDDIVAEPGTRVAAIGRGRIVWSGVRPGQAGRSNWGGLVIIGHRQAVTGKAFFSVYGHLSDIHVSVGDVVVAGQPLGVVAAAGTAESGGGKIPHLHFGVYVGPWRGTVLPGWWRWGQFRTAVRWWRDPRRFIEKYNS